MGCKEQQVDGVLVPETPLGETVMVTCPPGFEAGSMNITCAIDGEWEEPTDSCSMLKQFIHTYTFPIFIYFFPIY